MQHGSVFVGAGGDLDVQLRRSIDESRARSRRYGIDPRRVRKQSAARTSLPGVQERARDLLDAADPTVALAHAVLGDEPHMIAVSDADGVLVRFIASGVDETASNLFEGASWNEHDMGTNGIGTALAARSPVLIAGPQHLVHEYYGWTCIGVPLRGPEGQVLGALDLSVSNGHVSAHTWGWTLALVRSIEAELGRRRLEAWDRRKDSAFATLSHELNNPLQAMALSLELLDRTLREPSNDVRADRVERLRRQVKRLERVVGDIGDVARVKHGGLTVDKQIVDVNAIVNRAADAVQAQVASHGQTLARRPAPRPLLVNGDADRLEQVFTNILCNAVKYTPVGGHIAVSAQAVGGDAHVVIRDDGYGIAREDLQVIFGEFNRAVRDHNDPGGMGIGLSLVMTLVQLHGGAVIARSDGPGKGSEFEVTLPLAHDGGG